MMQTTTEASLVSCCTCRVTGWISCTASTAPTLYSVQRLRKLIGYFKNSGDIGIKLDWPEHGAGKWKKGTEAFWLLEGFTDADWCGNKPSRRSTSCTLLFVNGCFAFASSRSQRVISLSSAQRNQNFTV